MRIVIAGAGEVGTHLAKMLSNENHDLVVIDPDEKKLKVLESNLDLLTKTGSATSFNLLRESDIKNADLFIAVTTSEETNLVSSLLAKKLGAKKTIARIDNMEYLSPINKEYFTNLGIDDLIYPEMLASKEVISLLKQTGPSEIFDFSDGKLSLIVVKLDENAPIVNKTLAEAATLDKSVDYRIVAISRNGKTIIPRGDDWFEENDFVYTITNQFGIKNLKKYSGKEEYDIKNIMILGGSRIGKNVTSELQYQANIKIIEKDKDKSLKLADSFDHALVINGDGRNVDLLVGEGIKNMDAFIAVTGNSEINILVCSLAKRFGVKRTIAEIENLDYIDVSDNMGIDTVINKKLIAASKIFRFTMNAEVYSIKCLTGNDAEILELVAHQDSKITKDIIRNLNFPCDAIIGGIIRNKTGLIAKGESRIKVNDRVVVFALPSAIQKVEKFFK